ncbi:MAG: hypothetical protein IKG39_05950 [Lachnospiraceae bacterium]|nr:hypothetical protein [Lachnospiraceae bacterium]
MKVKVKIPFYATETGAVKRNEVLDVTDKLGKGLITNGLADPEDEPAKPAAKGTKKKA